MYPIETIEILKAIRICLEIHIFTEKFESFKWA